MLRAVDNGIYVGTEDGLFFMSGNNPSEFQRIKVLTKPVIKGSDVIVDNVDIGFEEVGVSIVFCCNDGIYYATNSGRVGKMSEAVVFNESFTNAYASVVNGQYVVTLT